MALTEVNIFPNSQYQLPSLKYGYPGQLIQCHLAVKKKPPDNHISPLPIPEAGQELMTAL